MDIPTPIEASPSAVTAPDSGISQPWGEMTYLATASPVPLLHEHPPTPIQMSRGGVRMDTSDGQLNGRPRHARSRFTAARRKEVHALGAESFERIAAKEHHVTRAGRFSRRGCGGLVACERGSRSSLICTRRVSRLSCPKIASTS
ncbi:hypothetical protein LB505_001284 [Fusarium chuoi]|nr:hypothetical protein LB505_001284 [Fusarium chuoi]